VLAEISQGIQERVVKLKHSYVSKRQQMMDKLDNHQDQIESLFKVYYETLDEMRNHYLQQEY
jgi:hypothetical protein